MLARTLGYGLNGVNGFEVKVEVYLSGGMMALEVVGLPDASVKESRDRVRAAIQNSGYTMPVGRLTVNLAPADMKKEGPAFDLPIALGILMASRQLDMQDLSQVLTLGELRDAQVDMFTTVFVGNSQTRRIGDKLVTPRGYKNV